MIYGVAVEKGGVQDILYQPDAQHLPFHGSQALNCMMIGSAGSGKSFTMRWDAYMRCLSVPRYRALLVRRSMPELRYSHLDHVPFEAKRLGLPDAAWHGTFSTLRFPNGSSLVFSQVEDDETLARFLSAEFEAIYFDELCTFTLRQFLFLASRARTDKPGIRPVVRGGTNPVGPGATWVRRFFVTKDVSPIELPGYRPDDYEQVRSMVDLNPHINLEEYEGRLNQLPSDALRKAMRHGEWVIEGAAFPEWEEGRHIVDAVPTYRGQPIYSAPHIDVVRVIDWGYAPTGNPGVCLWFACLTDGSAICFREYVFKETLPEDVAREILHRSTDVRVTYSVGDTAMWQEHEGPSIAEKFAQAGLSLVEADKARVPGWIQVHTWLRETVTDVTATGAKTRPRLTFLRSGCPTAIRTIPQMIVDPRDPHDIVTKDVEDDAADCVRYFTMSRPGRSHEKAQRNPNLDWIFREIAKRKSRYGRIGTESTRRVM